MPLLFDPQREAMFSWGDVAPPLAALRGEPGVVTLVVPPGERRAVDGTFRSLGESVAALAAVPIAALGAVAPSVAAFCLASKLALDLVARERVVPWADAGRARWAVALSADDEAQVATLAAAWPHAAHACCTDLADRPAKARALDVWEPEALLRAFLDGAADALVRSAAGHVPAPLATAHGPWERRWIKALATGEATFEPSGFGERTLARDLQRWSRPARGARRGRPPGGRRRRLGRGRNHLVRKNAGLRAARAGARWPRSGAAVGGDEGA